MHASVSCGKSYLAGVELAKTIGEMTNNNPK